MNKPMQNLMELFGGLGTAYGHLFLDYELFSWDMAGITLGGAGVGYILGSIVKYLKEL